MNLFKCNVGKVDRIIRILVGVALIANVFVGLTSPLGWIGVIFVVTGIFAICPLYSLLKIDTRSMGERVGIK